MKKFIIGAIMAIASVVGFAKPFAYVDFADARLYLDDDKKDCPEPFTGSIKVTFTDKNTPELGGCWLMNGEDIYLMDSNGLQKIIPAAVFTDIEKSSI